MSLQKFGNGEFNLNVLLDENNELLFFGKEIATILGYANTKRAVQRLVEEKDKLEWQDLQGGNELPPCYHPQKILIKEPGFYSLVFRSTLPQAKEFRRWVFEQVLPQIRKTGSYSLNTGLLKLRDISEEDIEKMSKDEKKSFKQEIKKFADLLKDPVNQEKGSRGGNALWKKLRDQEELYEELQKKLAAIDLILNH